MSASYGLYAASAASALGTARTLTATVLPLSITHMYEGLGENAATSVLAAVAMLFCFTSVVFLRYGRGLARVEWSTWAMEGVEALRNENHDLGKECEGKHKWRLWQCGIRL